VYCLADTRTLVVRYTIPQCAHTRHRPSQFACDRNARGLGDFNGDADPDSCANDDNDSVGEPEDEHLPAAVALPRSPSSALAFYDPHAHKLPPAPYPRLAQLGRLLLPCSATRPSHRAARQARVALCRLPNRGDGRERTGAVATAHARRYVPARCELSAATARRGLCGRLRAHPSARACLGGPRSTG
jgi:hypothetical protein